jgi:hypothetical protein
MATVEEEEEEMYNSPLSLVIVIARLTSHFAVNYRQTLLPPSKISTKNKKSTRNNSISSKPKPKPHFLSKMQANHLLWPRSWRIGTQVSSGTHKKQQTI